MMQVSVIIPVHNAEPYLDECIQSVLAQEYEPFEVVAVENKSTDGSLRILEKYAPRVTIVRELRPGCAAARNAGVRASTGELLAFIDADDVWLPGRISTHVKVLNRNPEVGIAFGQFADWDCDGSGEYPEPGELLVDPELWHPKPPLAGWIYADALLFCPIAMITPTIRREVFETVGGFNESLEAGSDYDFWLRALYHYQAELVPGCVALYRHHGEGITSRPRSTCALAQVLMAAVERYGLAGPDGRQVAKSQIDERFREIWFHHALLHFRSGNLATGWEAFGRYARLEASWGTVVRRALSCAPSVLRTRGARLLIGSR